MDSMTPTFLCVEINAPQKAHVYYYCTHSHDVAVVRISISIVLSLLVCKRKSVSINLTGIIVLCALCNFVAFVAMGSTA